MTLRTLPFLALALAAVMAASPALAGQLVNLRPSVVDATGHVTLGESFDDAGAASGVEVATRTGPTVVLNAAAVQSLARRYGLEWANPQGLLRIIVRAEGGSQGGRTGNLEILTWARNVNTGEVVQPQDLIWAKAAAAPSDAPRSVENVIGMMARRPLRDGDAVGTHDVAAPMVIKAGDIVSVTYEDDGISLTLQAKAISNAAIGESFNIQNPSSKKVIEAVATGAGQAVVGPEAMRLKAEHTPSQLALR